MTGLVSVHAVSPVIHFSAKSQPSPAPALRSFFPISPQQGKFFQTKVLGKVPNNAYGIWFQNSGLNGEITKIEKTEFQETTHSRGNKKWVQGHPFPLTVEGGSG